MISQHIKDLVDIFRYFGDTKDLLTPEVISVSVDDFVIIIDGDYGFYIISVDLKESFNKNGQCPIHFELSDYFECSQEIKNRIQDALRYLLTNKNKAGEFVGKLDGFDDLSSTVRDSFYKNQ